ncbi:arginine deiminase [Cytobacillus gottheilii]|uniref:arginine deiminase n=1 Tax=Cytobacillus gottheilii TaxID=859144 RepID=UPI0009B95931|nr:arginine deiminase [Cytobacillus gottheilii]
MQQQLNVTSEIGRLKTVMLHRPGLEIEHLMPQYLERLLFDDTPHLPIIQKEHDYFAQQLTNRDIEVLYLDVLMKEAVQNQDARQYFMDEILKDGLENLDGSYDSVKEYFQSLGGDELVSIVMSGVPKSKIPKSKQVHLHEITNEHYPFYLDPMPNLYFTRDPAAVIGNGISINRMYEPARRRESIFVDTIMKFHPRFRDAQKQTYFSRNDVYSMEGGDQLVLSSEVLAIGVSARTTAQGIEKLASEVFKQNNTFKKVLAVEIPKKRAYMHLDTVFTMVDYDKFTYHPGIESEEGGLNIYILEKTSEEGEFEISRKSDLTSALKEVLNLKEITLIPCGGGCPIAAAREQWNDGSNTLSIAPGVVVTYDRNTVTNNVLREHGIEVIEIESSELSRGRGGPRCMSMPLVRENL